MINTRVDLKDKNDTGELKKLLSEVERDPWVGSFLRGLISKFLWNIKSYKKRNRLQALIDSRSVESWTGGEYSESTSSVAKQTKEALFIIDIGEYEKEEVSIICKKINEYILKVKSRWWFILWGLNWDLHDGSSELVLPQYNSRILSQNIQINLFFDSNWNLSENKTKKSSIPLSLEVKNNLKKYGIWIIYIVWILENSWARLSLEEISKSWIDVRILKEATIINEKQKKLLQKNKSWIKIVESLTY